MINVRNFCVLAGRVGLACLLVVTMAMSANAQTVKWVDQAGGNDVNDGNSEATAYETLQFAIDNSTSGVAVTPSVINVKDGAYLGKVGQTGCSGLAAAVVVSNLDFLKIQAVPGAEPSIRAAFDSVSMSIEDSQHVVIDNIDLDGSMCLAGVCDRLLVCDSGDVTVKNSEIFEGEDGIDVESGHEGFLVENNVFHGLRDDAVDFSDGAYSDITIQDNLFEADNRRPILIRNFGGLPIEGVVIQRNISLGTNEQEAFRIIGAKDVLIQNNVIMNSFQQAIYIDKNESGGSPSSNITIRHNSLFHSGEEELRLKVTGADILVHNNIFYPNGASAAISVPSGFVGALPSEDHNLIFNEGNGTESGSAIAVSAFGGNTITGQDPMFVSTTLNSEDLHLTLGSPAIEAGLELGVTDDIEKKSRPRPAVTDPDMGAYEFSVEPIEVEIDITPRRAKNKIFLKYQKFIKVAILTTDDFDATTVNGSTVKFGPSEASPKREVGRIIDVDHDGDKDVVFKFRLRKTGIQCGDTSATLIGETNDGQSIVGTDSIVTKRCKHHGHHYYY